MIHPFLTIKLKNFEMWRRIWLPFFYLFNYICICLFIYFQHCVFLVPHRCFWNIYPYIKCGKNAKEKYSLNFDKQFENCNLQMKSQPVSTLSLVLHLHQSSYICYILNAFALFTLCLVLGIRDVFKNKRN